MSKKETIEFLLQECEFTVDEDGYFSGSAQFQLTNLPNEGVVAQAYLKMQKQDSVVLVSDVSEGRLSEADDTLYVGVAGMLDGNATPDSFFLNYRIIVILTVLKLLPSLPSSFGEQSLSVSPKGLLGGKNGRVEATEKFHPFWCLMTKVTFLFQQMLNLAKLPQIMWVCLLRMFQTVCQISLFWLVVKLFPLKINMRPEQKLSKIG